MVFFTCNACGASLKKNQVEKHYQNECRNCEVLSCMDCGRDFYGDEYTTHTKCISEAEKYQGALFKDTGVGGATKGERKQQEWLHRVKQSSSSAKVSGKVASLLERIAQYPNVPRKKKKFENFVRNSVNVWDQPTLDQLWDAFNEATKPQEAPVANGTDRTDQELPVTESKDEELETVTKKKRKSKKHSDNEESKVDVSVEAPKKKHKHKSKKHSDLDAVVTADVIQMVDKKHIQSYNGDTDVSVAGKKKKRKRSDKVDGEVNEQRTKKAKTSKHVCA